MDTLMSIQVFRQIVDSGSLAAAAERLTLSKAMVTKHLKNLETRLGARLLNRNSHSQSLTEPGQLYFERCKLILQDLDEAASAVGNINGAPRGTLKVTCPSWVGTHRVANLLAAYVRRYPDVVVDMAFEDRLVDLVAEGYDLALRCTAEPPPDGLIGRKLRAVPFIIAASPEYLRKRGIPRSPQDLVDHDCVMVGNGNSWELTTASGTLRVPAHVVLRFQATTPAVAHAVVAGVGLAPLPLVLLEEPIFKGKICPVLPDTPLRQRNMYALYASRRYVSPKIRTFIDHLIEYLATVPLPSALETALPDNCNPLSPPPRSPRSAAQTTRR
jgi:DNA-binding transcriptional LysR family regulator